MNKQRHLSILLLVATFSGCERWTLDRQLDELCAKDGGVQIYEKVVLPRAEFNRVLEGLSHGSSPTAGGYKYQYEIQTLAGKDANTAKGDGKLQRSREVIVRLSDAKVLGEEILYTRVGGDWMTFGFQPSSNTCPKRRVGIALAVFSKG